MASMSRKERANDYLQKLKRNPTKMEAREIAKSLNSLVFTKSNNPLSKEDKLAIINEMLEQNNSSHLKEGVSAKELITRPEITYDMMLPYIDAPELSEEQRRRITILIKYAGYIEKAKRQAQKQIKMEEKHIPEDIDYEDVKNLALEAKQKLSEIRPLTIGQASRISGINPADISVLLIYLKQKYNGE